LVLVVLVLRVRVKRAGACQVFLVALALSVEVLLVAVIPLRNVVESAVRVRGNRIKARVVLVLLAKVSMVVTRRVHLLAVAGEAPVEPVQIIVRKLSVLLGALVCRRLSQALQHLEAVAVEVVARRPVARVVTVGAVTALRVKLMARRVRLTPVAVAVAVLLPAVSLAAVTAVRGSLFSVFLRARRCRSLPVSHTPPLQWAIRRLTL
jgi:hypothetical protein